MAKVFDWKSSEVQRDIVHIVVQAIVEGKLVVLPTETAYHVVCSALNDDAVRQANALRLSGKVASPSLLTRSAEESFDFSPGMSRIARRAVYRGWPGPLVLELPVAITAEQAEHVASDISVVNQLPQESQSLLVNDGFLAQRVVPHPIVIDAMRLTPGPLLAFPCIDSEGNSIASAAAADDSVGESSAVVVDDGATHFGGFATRIRVDGSDCHLLDAGVIDAEIRHRLFQFVMLIVCTGNTCRSPMAEVLMRKQLSERFPDAFEDPSKIHVSSAGVSAFPGGPASTEAQVVMEKCGLSLRDHQSRTVTEQAVRNADLILAMTSSHRAALLSQFPEAENKVHLLGGDGQDVADPFGGTEAIYRECADQIDRFVEAWVKRVNESWFPNWLPQNQNAS
ncbi:MAG: Sua5/YciO/YrdC/YwlC family protein [Aureliella sp.]